ncbi:triosephosphate isomerase [Candidatus Phycosocius bacilliformis]|uniref:Triosephosphate isomerase n=1 Tax=Candidatus Phycosocius bacilliformis TaxID=1445552 RepID=A0A2P2E869_9PROT|nr:triose-phosphate isomerase [Candidatus Phycosocius bacilliformis]GBF57266.1 triosephosphate isomerase [Candidatus Phycosocius bacilliformis]
MTIVLVGNWKMNGLEASLDEARQIAAEAGDASRRGVSLTICPPATLLARLSEAVAGTGLSTGGQDCHARVSGPHTGDVSAEMLKDAGAAYVIVGHSERRADHGETSAIVKAKAEAGLRAGLTPIICVGETRAEREAGKAEAVVLAQVEGSIPDGFASGQFILAYEPVWAIGTGLVASPQDVAIMHGAIHNFLVGRFGPIGATIPILYGGSVNAQNAAELLKTAHVGGALVGGASLTADGFLKILKVIA